MSKRIQYDLPAFILNYFDKKIRENGEPSYERAFLVAIMDLINYRLKHYDIIIDKAEILRPGVMDEDDAYLKVSYEDKKFKEEACKKNPYSRTELTREKFVIKTVNYLKVKDVFIIFYFKEKITEDEKYDKAAHIFTEVLGHFISSLIIPFYVKVINESRNIVDAFFKGDQNLIIERSKRFFDIQEVRQ